MLKVILNHFLFHLPFNSNRSPCVSFDLYCFFPSLLSDFNSKWHHHRILTRSRFTLPQYTNECIERILRSRTNISRKTKQILMNKNRNNNNNRHEDISHKTLSRSHVHTHTFCTRCAIVIKFCAAAAATSIFLNRIEIKATTISILLRLSQCVTDIHLD